MKKIVSLLILLLLHLVSIKITFAAVTPACQICIDSPPLGNIEICYGYSGACYGQERPGNNPPPNQNPPSSNELCDLCLQQNNILICHGENRPCDPDITSDCSQCLNFHKPNIGICYEPNMACSPNYNNQNPTDNIFEGPTDATFDALNPLKQNADSDVAEQLSTPGGIITRTLNFLFPISGLILFVMIVWGGFEVLAGSSSGKSLDAGKQRITAAIIGFLLLFSSYWLIQIIEVVFGLVIVG